MNSTVWIVEFMTDYCTDFFCAYATEKEAMQEAYGLVIEDFTTNNIIWDMSDYDIASVASSIVTGFKSQRSDLCREALVKYNEYLYDYNVKVCLKVFSTQISTPNQINHLDDSFFSALCDDEEDEEEEIEEVVKQDLASMGDGATCRKCHIHNEYANPDTSDGSYCCTPCKTFINVFSQQN